MDAIKTKAIVEDSDHLKLSHKFDFLKQGAEIDILILPSLPKNVVAWQDVLDKIGTYSDEDLAGFQQSRKDFNTWQPREF